MSNGEERRTMTAAGILEQVRGTITVKRVFGEAYASEGCLVVPVAAVRGGGGGGDGADAGGNGGSGGGFGGFCVSEFCFVVGYRVFYDFCECDGVGVGCDFFGEVSCGDAVGYGGSYRGVGVCE